MPSFSIALTGLKADSVALNTIGNNLANLNTTAFKKQTAQFSDLLYQNIGSSGANTPLQIGVGTKVSNIASDYTQGSLSVTGTSTNMAINGDGFFLVQKDGSQALTRSGDFQLDQYGNLITSSGLNVMGYPAVNGDINRNTGVVPIVIPTGQMQQARATNDFSMTAVLNSSSTVGASFANSIAMYDSLGTAHEVTVTFTKAADNEWNYAVTIPGTEATSASGNTGTLKFDSDGNLALPSSDISGISFSGMKDAASDMQLNWSLYDDTGKGLITQTAVASSVNATHQNGYATGKYKSFTVDGQGVITASFSNGNSQQLGQIAVATVANVDGLARLGGNLYQANDASGLASIGVAGTGGRGDVEGSSLEQSNVDISAEFANLIVAQRAFQANSKTVTAFDAITQDTINMVR
ncbi:MAG: flagellar hook protein FlgE [Acidobacteria bacterium]|nr:flagellar hook protein FlgE [Acidobacteriota bacterium]